MKTKTKAIVIGVFTVTFLLLAAFLWLQISHASPAPTQRSVPVAGPLQQGSCQTLNSPNVPKAIPDRTTITSTLFVADTGYVQSVAVNLSISHTYFGDLEVHLCSPTGCSAALWVRYDTHGNYPHGDGTFAFTFDDSSANLLADSGSPYGGTYKPASPLLGIPARAGGSWRLIVADMAGGDVGTLNSWGITVCTARTAPSATPTPSATSTPGLPTETPTSWPTVGVGTPYGPTVSAAECLSHVQVNYATPVAPGTWELVYDGPYFSGGYWVEAYEFAEVVDNVLVRWYALWGWSIEESTTGAGQISGVIGVWEQPYSNSGTSISVVYDTSITQSDSGQACHGYLGFDSYNMGYWTGSIGPSVGEHWTIINDETLFAVNLTHEVRAPPYDPLIPCNNIASISRRIQVTLNGCYHDPYPTPGPTSTPGTPGPTPTPWACPPTSVPNAGWWMW